MSHYAVAVFSDDADFERLLAPYNESNEKYFVFIEKPYEEIVDEFNEFRIANGSWTLGQYIKEFGYEQENGKWGFRQNPRGYWDWYTLDGKDYMFDLRKDVAAADDWNGYWRKNDYDWFVEDKDEMRSAAAFWDKYVAQEYYGHDYPSLWSREYYLERFKTKEQYVKEIGRVIPYAFVTPDGEWHAAGRVGWFASSTETAEDADRYAEEWLAYLRSEGNPYVSLVDCHI